MTSLNPSPIPILTYHQIAKAGTKGTPFRSLCVAPESFRRQMWLLKKLGYQGVSMTGLLPYLRGEKHGRVVGITFDDGYQNNLVHALPVLRKLGFSSTCYVVSGLLGQTNQWDVEKGVNQVPLMNGEELRQWLRGGQEVGAHTCHHVALPELSSEACWTEIHQCKLSLEAGLGTSIDHFCYPYGAYEARHVEEVERAGYLTATTTQRGRIKFGADLLQAKRIPVLKNTSLALLTVKLLTGYEDGR